ncbi:MAG: outer membrane lipoprotein carrier protein LolA [Pseudomonadota bacterium]
MIRRLAHRTVARLAVALLLFGPVIAPAQGVNQGDLLRISNYLNGISTLEGNFVQVGPDGDLSEGTFYLRRPGRMRFQYEPPNPALIIVDGVWVGVCDPQVRTFDRFPLSETPLSLLLRERVDLRKEGAVRSIERSAGQLRVEAVDPGAPEQGSITMVFADNPLELRQWVVVDNQGLTTTIALSDTRANVSLGGDLFYIDDAVCGY